MMRRMSWEPSKLPVPYRLETPRLRLRPWNPADAPQVKAAIDTSLDHLRRFLPWTATEPQTLEEKVTLLRQFRARFDLGEEYVFGVFSADADELLGGVGLHPRVGPWALEIGYWMRVGQIGRGYATEAAAALTRVGFERLGLAKIEIRCDPENLSSARVPQKLGYRQEAHLRQAISGPQGGLRDCLVWSLLREEYAAAPVARVEVRAWDALDRPIQFGDARDGPRDGER